MNIFKKIAFGTVILTMLFALLSFVSCGEPELVPVPEEDLPYGGNVLEMDKGYYGVPIAIEFDKRYLTEDEGRLISDYYSSVSKRDGELYKACHYQDYGKFYSEREGCNSEQEMVEKFYNNLKDNYIFSDFSLDYIIVKDCMERTPENAATFYFDNADAMFTSYGLQCEDTNIISKVSSRKVVTLEIYFSTEEGSFSLVNRLNGQEILLYIYTIDGGCYVIW